MRVINQIRLFLVFLSIFMSVVVSSKMPQSSEGEGDEWDSNNDFTESQWVNVGNSSSNCDSIPVSVAVLPWPPYAGSVSDDWHSKVIAELRSGVELNHYTNPITFRKTSNESELEKLFKENKTDIGFPLITRFGSAQSDMVLENHPGLDFLVAPETPSPGEVCMNTLLQSWPLLALSLILTGIAGILIWLLEVISNREEFPSSFATGTWEGFWWAFISMTTVGYGDKCPRSVAGRCFAVIWIFAGLILVAVFMANVTTALTSVSVKPEYKLSETEVGVVSESLEEEVARNINAEVKVFENYDKLMTAFRQRHVSGIVIDHYAAGVHLLNEKDAFRHQIFQSKHFSLSMKYEITANISQSKYEEMMNDHDECYSDILDLIKEVTSKHLGQKEIQGLRGIRNSSSTTKHSFNLFIESKDALKRATYISLGILAALIFVGLVVEKIFWKARSHETGDYELRKIHEDDEIMQEIAQGKELLNKLLLLHQNLEEKINLNSTWKRKSEKFRYSNNNDDEEKV